MDLLLYETNNGGDLSVQENDLATTNALWTQIYIAMFGGNLEARTGDNVNGDNVDFWGNFFIQDKDEQFNSVTEKTINETAITSSGLLIIQQAVETDLSFLNKLGTVTVEVSSPKIDTLEIIVKIQEPDNVTDNQFKIIWDATRSAQIIGAGESTGGGFISGWILRNGIWDDLGRWIDTEYWKDDINS